MRKTILLTGATDGIGLATAEMLAAQGHRLLLHGRNPEKLEQAKRRLTAVSADSVAECYVADLSRIRDVVALAQAVTGDHASIDVLINNAGVFRTGETISPDGLDVRFAVNTIAPCLLTRRLLPLLDSSSRIVNLSSAAQSPVDADALAGKRRLADDFTAYAQSKLALTMWSLGLADSLGDDGPVVIAVNPGSMLGSKMVKEGFGVDGGDIRIGADILIRAALSDEFAAASGQYFDNDAGRFASPHADAMDAGKRRNIIQAIDEVINDLT